MAFLCCSLPVDSDVFITSVSCSSVKLNEEQQKVCMLPNKVSLTIHYKLQNLVLLRGADLSGLHLKKHS